MPSIRPPRSAARLLASASLLLSAATLAPASGHAADAPPSTPGGLVANAYSGTAGGLRWNRSSDDRGAVAGYEVSRDGQVLGVVGALSYIERSLTPGRAYRYAVVAIDGAGQRSGQATVSLSTPDAPPPTPAGLRAAAYSGTAGGITWTRPAVTGLRHEVRRDGQVMATSPATSYVDKTLAPGRTYTYEVVAIDRAGRRSPSAAITLATPGDPTPEPPDALPLTDAQRALLPDDCLLALDDEAVAYCFAAEGRLLIAALPDGTLRYRFALPGTNADNRVLALELAGGKLILVAETTGTNGVPAHEMSRFDTGGAFVDTVAILEPFRRLRGDFSANPPAWNLDGAGVLVAADADALYVGTGVHALRVDGDPNRREDWRAVGASLTRVDANDGARKAYRVLPDAGLAALEIDAGALLATLADGTLRRYRLADIAPATLDASTPTFDPTRLPTLVPYLYEQLQGHHVDRLDADVDALLAHLGVWDTPLEPDCVLLDPPQPGGDCFGESSETPRRVDCAAGGAFVASREAFVRFTGGAGQGRGESRRAEFDACIVEVASPGRLPTGTYRLSGTFETAEAEEPFHRGSTVTTSSAFDELDLSDPDDTTRHASGELRERAMYFGYEVHARDIAFERFSSTRPGEAREVTGLELHVEREDYAHRLLSIEGRVRVSGEETGEEALTLETLSPLSNLYAGDDPQRLAGTLRIENVAGEGLTLEAFENPAIPDEELVRQARDADGGATTVRPFESLLVPFFAERAPND